MNIITAIFLFSALAALATYLVLWLMGFRIIPNDRCALVETRWSSRGSLTDRIIALNGEAGYQPKVLRGGIHFRSPIKYRVHKIPLVTVPQGQIGYVFARDGAPLQPKQTLGKVIPQSNDFQSVRGFLKGNGQRGPQRGIIREGTYALNLAQFVVILMDDIYYYAIDKGDSKTFRKMADLIRGRDGFRPLVIRGKHDNMGIVTIHDGPALCPGEIIAPLVGEDTPDSGLNHNNFQDPERFLKAGGRRGRQYQVLVDGTYFLNRLFATVEIVGKTVVPVGHVGVVVSYVGGKGWDASGKDYKHGELVEVGHKGVWKDALMPGKYAFNIYAGKVIQVPTTNIVLKWKKNEIGNHKFDENLSAVDLITKDAFEPELPLSVVIHIDYRKAPLVIQRFGDVKKLVDQTLDPMVAAYFKNIGQTKTVIELIQKRNEIQTIASTDMKKKFLHYDLELEEVLIGTPASSGSDERIERILFQLRERQIAQEQIRTYEKQEMAAVKERELNEARAKAKQQEALTESEVSIDIQKNFGRAEFERSLQEASKIKALASANAEKVTRLGIAKAISVEEQVAAYGGPKYQVVQQTMDRFSEAVEKAKIDIVPKMVMGGENGGGGRSAFEALLAVMLSEKMDVDLDPKRAPSNRAKQVKEEILKGIERGQVGPTGTRKKGSPA